MDWRRLIVLTCFISYCTASHSGSAPPPVNPPSPPVNPPSPPVNPPSPPVNPPSPPVNPPSPPVNPPSPPVNPPSPPVNPPSPPVNPPSPPVNPPSPPINPPSPPVNPPSPPVNPPSPPVNTPSPPVNPPSPPVNPPSPPVNPPSPPVNPPSPPVNPPSPPVNPPSPPVKPPSPPVNPPSPPVNPPSPPVNPPSPPVNPPSPPVNPPSLPVNPPSPPVNPPSPPLEPVDTLTIHITKENAPTPDNDIYIVGEEVKYRCSVSGRLTKPTLRLITSGSTKPAAETTLSSEVGSPSMVFSKTMTAEDDKQKVYCEVVIDGKVPVKSEELLVRVLSDPEFKFDNGATFIQGKVGDSMDTTCSVTNYHKSVPLDVTWYQKKDENEVKLDCSKTNMPPSATLRGKLKESDKNTVVYCKATYEQNKLQKTSKPLPVQLVLSPKVELVASVHRKTGDTTYKCSAKFESLLKPRSYNLKLMSKSKGETKEIEKKQDEELLSSTLKNATIGEGAQIFCVVNCDINKDDRCSQENTYSIIYNVIVPPPAAVKLISLTESKVYLAGETAKFRCEVDNPSKLDFQFITKQNDVTLNDKTQSENDIFALDFTKELSVKDDNTELQCVAKIDDTSLSGVSNKIQLNVVSDLTTDITPPVEKIFEMEGKPVEYSCETKKVAAAKIEWHYKKSETAPVQTIEGPSFKRTLIASDNGAEIYCTSSYHGRTVKSKVIPITVIATMVVDIEPKPDSGSVKELQCDIKNPPLNYKVEFYQKKDGGDTLLQSDAKMNYVITKIPNECDSKEEFYCQVKCTDETDYCFGKKFESPVYVMETTYKPKFTLSKPDPKNYAINETIELKCVLDNPPKVDCGENRKGEYSISLLQKEGKDSKVSDLRTVKNEKTITFSKRLLQSDDGTSIWCSLSYNNGLVTTGSKTESFKVKIVKPQTTTPTASKTTTTSTEKPDIKARTGLSSGAIVGIVLGVSATVLALAGVAFYLKKKAASSALP